MGSASTQPPGTEAVSGRLEGHTERLGRLGLLFASRSEKPSIGLLGPPVALNTHLAAGRLAEVHPFRARKSGQSTACLGRCFQFDEPQDDFAVTLAGHAHDPHAVHHRRLDLDEALASIALHRPSCRALGKRRGDGVIGFISKGDANRLQRLIPAER